MSDAVQRTEAEQRSNMMSYAQANLTGMIMSDLSNNIDNRNVLKKYKQSEVREIIDNYTSEKNQIKLREISSVLFAKSPQYQRVVRHFRDMALFLYVITPSVDIKKLPKEQVLKEYTALAEKTKAMNIQHEMKKVLMTLFIEDTYFGYVHETDSSFYIQKVSPKIAKISSIEDGVFNYKIDMSYFKKDERRLNGWADEVVQKYAEWKRATKGDRKVDNYVELDSDNTICIKLNEEMPENFPLFAGTFDSIFDIEGFKKLRKDKEELGNYMLLSQELPMRKEGDNNNDFLIDHQMMMLFHNMAIDTVPDNVGVITSPMPIKPIKFDRDRADNDGVAKAERDAFSAFGTSQLLFNADKSTSQGLNLSIKTDEEIVYSIYKQIERWLNRRNKLKNFSKLFSISILPITVFNREDMFKMYMESGNAGFPVKNHIASTIGLEPIETMNLAYLENDLLKMNESFLPLLSAHTSTAEDLEGGRPKKDASEISDETSRSQDKPNA